MKASLTLEFDTPAALYAAVDRLRGKEVVQITQEVFIPAAATLPDVQPTSVSTRKPRNDAGKPRGPYKTTTPTTGEPAASEPGVRGQASAAPSQPAAPATPTTSAAPVNPSATATATTPTPAAAEPGALTLEDAKAALRRVKDTKGLGTQVCIALIQQFGYDRISDLPAAKFAEFIAAANDKVARLGEKA